MYTEGPKFVQRTIPVVVVLRHTLKISSKSVHNFLSSVVDRHTHTYIHTDRQTERERERERDNRGMECSAYTASSDVARRVSSAQLRVIAH